MEKRYYWQALQETVARYCSDLYENRENRATRILNTIKRTDDRWCGYDRLKDTRFTYLETSYVRDAKLFLRDIELRPVRTSHQLLLVIRESDWATYFT
jgi:hypothetical protein